MSEVTPKPPVCMFCGYDMTGLDQGKCPECGRPVFRFTDRARAVIVEANAHSLRLLRGEEPDQGAVRWWWPTPTPPALILPSHVLLGIISGPEGIARHAMLSCGADLDVLRKQLVRQWPAGRAVAIPEGARLPLHPRTWRIVQEAIDQAVSLAHAWVGTEHLLLSLCVRGDRAVRRSLFGAGVTHQRVREIIIQNMAAIGSVDAVQGATRGCVVPGSAGSNERSQ